MRYRWKGTKSEAIEGLLIHSSNLMDEVKTLRDSLSDPNSSIPSIFQNIANHVFGISSLREEQIRVMTQVIHHVDTVFVPSLHDC